MLIEELEDIIKTGDIIGFQNLVEGINKNSLNDKKRFKENVKKLSNKCLNIALYNLIYYSLSACPYEFEKTAYMFNSSKINYLDEVQNIINEYRKKCYESCMILLEDLSIEGNYENFDKLMQEMLVFDYYKKITDMRVLNAWRIETYNLAIYDNIKFYKPKNIRILSNYPSTLNIVINSQRNLIKKIESEKINVDKVIFKELKELFNNQELYI